MCFGNTKVEEVESFLDSEKQMFDFNKVIPIDDYDRDNVVKSWGTKWNSYTAHKIKTSDYKVTYMFETAWDYPKPIIDAIFDRFKDIYIDFSAACEGGWFAICMSRDDENGDIETMLFDSEAGNDPDGKIRSCIHKSLKV